MPIAHGPPSPGSHRADSRTRSRAPMASCTTPRRRDPTTLVPVSSVNGTSAPFTLTPLLAVRATNEPVTAPPSSPARRSHSAAELVYRLGPRIGRAACLQVTAPHLRLAALALVVQRQLAAHVRRAVGVVRVHRADVHAHDLERRVDVPQGFLDVDGHARPDTGLEADQRGLALGLLRALHLCIGVPLRGASRPYLLGGDEQLLPSGRVPPFVEVDVRRGHRPLAVLALLGLHEDGVRQFRCVTAVGELAEGECRRQVGRHVGEVERRRRGRGLLDVQHVVEVHPVAQADLVGDRVEGLGHAHAEHVLPLHVLVGHVQLPAVEVPGVVEVRQDPADAPQR